MKRMTPFFIQLVLILTHIIPLLGQNSSKTSLAVLDFEGRGISSPEAASLTDWFTSILVDGSVYQVIERNRTQEILSEQGFQQTGCISDECAVEAGKLLGVEKMITGSIGKVGTVFTVNVRMFDVTSGVIERVSRQNYRGQIEGLFDVLFVIAKDLGTISTEVIPIETTETKGPKSTDQVFSIPATAEAESDEVIRGQMVTKGGLSPLLATFCIGPRVGLEMNEGKKIQTDEWIAFGGSLVGPSIHSSVAALTRAYMAYKTGGKMNGMSGFAASFCIGPRVGAELHKREIRDNEWLTFCFVGTCLIGAEAYRGKTMTEIEVAEGLRKQ